jgi:hypothetical protein
MKEQTKPSIPKIYRMELHESYRISTYVAITRVSGGCIYTYLDNQRVETAAVFVRYDTEFLD